MKTLSNNDFSIPSFKEFNLIKKINFKVPQLKQIAKYYKQPVSGKKQDLIDRIFKFLKNSSHALLIQRIYKGHLQKKYNKAHGPAFINRELCTNDTDFFTLDNVKDIPYNQFFSFKDEDGFIYGFDIASIYNIVLKNNLACENPYNRKKLSGDIISDIRTVIRLSKILKIKIQPYIKENVVLSARDKIKHRTIAIFQEIDQLGNYSDHNWFLNLTSIRLYGFIRELIDIWNYRAQIQETTKKMICPPNGDPFRNTDMLIVRTMTYESMQRFSLSCIENLVKTGIDAEHKSLGAIYVLTALTLVSDNAATSLPWLYQSVAHV